jgi:hypothetical protein
MFLILPIKTNALSEKLKATVSYRTAPSKSGLLSQILIKGIYRKIPDALKNYTYNHPYPATA